MGELEKMRNRLAIKRYPVLLDIENLNGEINGFHGDIEGQGVAEDQRVR